eukprot:TRINITY_DN1800_c0_g1_i3.p1 TRINITY_DN1800_c0_g1~~TRINITY_DN1800_c0_g1_i3.p1  ORF type:complete len:294 (-),score=64.29 TRINITY_DN1800_c0_g1_i3:880-1761(-)
MSYNLRKRSNERVETIQPSSSKRRQPTNNNNNTQTHPTAPLQRKFTVSGNDIIHQLLQTTNVFFMLDPQSVFTLTLTSKVIFQQLIPLISQHYVFYYPKYRPLNFYHPQKLKVRTFNIKGLLLIPFLDSLREIVFDNKFNSPIKTLPTTVTRIKFGHRFKQEVNTNNLPANLTHLELGNDFALPLEDLPKSLTHLTVDGLYNRPIGNLPPNLVFLKFGFWFSQTIKNLPSNLKHLELGYKQWYQRRVRGIRTNKILQTIPSPPSLSKPWNSVYCIVCCYNLTRGTTITQTSIQ